MAEPVGYMERSRAFYAAQGYDRPYRWAQFDAVPFTPLAKPVSESVLTAITTAALHDRQPFEPREIASFETAEAPARLYAGDLSWDKQATHLDDINSFIPIAPLKAAAEAGRIGTLARRFHCARTDYSHRRTQETDAPELLARARADGADIALLVPL